MEGSSQVGGMDSSSSILELTLGLAVKTFLLSISCDKAIKNEKSIKRGDL